MPKTILTLREVESQILKTWQHPHSAIAKKVFGIPRGGWNIAQLLDRGGLATQVQRAEDADLLVDDIIDSGSTAEAYRMRYGVEVWAPYVKLEGPDKNTQSHEWFVFPWEGDAEADGQDLVRRTLQYIGEDVNRPGLKGTPERVVRSWQELYGGYGMDVDAILHTVFPSESKDMVICRDIEFYSQCEHHMIPFFGSVSIAYIPNGHVVGLSKLARAVEAYARRLQIQEQLGEQIADSMIKSLPLVDSVAVVIKAKHMCMCGRGVGKQSSFMVTSALRGKFRKDAALRAEFLSLLSI